MPQKQVNGNNFLVCSELKLILIRTLVRGSYSEAAWKWSENVYHKQVKESGSKILMAFALTGNGDIRHQEEVCDADESAVQATLHPAAQTRSPEFLNSFSKQKYIAHNSNWNIFADMAV